MLMKIYGLLLRHHGPQYWWPCRTGNKFEICIGAILTQNTNWANVEKAISNLIDAKAIGPEKISRMNSRKLQSLIKSSGFFRQKARRLKEFSRFVLTFRDTGNFLRSVTRDQLLGVKGIGRETADSILLYACGKPYFVVDTYTRRMLSSLGLVNSEDYEGVRRLFEDNIPRDAGLYKEFHALIVKHAKTCCRGLVKDGCILMNLKGQ